MRSCNHPVVRCTLEIIRDFPTGVWRWECSREDQSCYQNGSLQAQQCSPLPAAGKCRGASYDFQNVCTFIYRSHVVGIPPVVALLYRAVNFDDFVFWKRYTVPPRWSAGWAAAFLPFEGVLLFLPAGHSGGEQMRWWRCSLVCRV